MTSIDWAKTKARRDENHLSFVDLVRLVLEILQYVFCFSGWVPIPPCNIPLHTLVGVATYSKYYSSWGFRQDLVHFVWCPHWVYDLSLGQNSAHIRGSVCCLFCYVAVESSAHHGVQPRKRRVDSLSSHPGVILLPHTTQPHCFFHGISPLWIDCTHEDISNHLRAAIVSDVPGKDSDRVSIPSSCLPSMANATQTGISVGIRWHLLRLNSHVLSYVSWVVVVLV